MTKLNSVHRFGSVYQPLEETIEEQQSETIENKELGSEDERQTIWCDNFQLVDLKSYNTKECRHGPFKSIR